MARSKAELEKEYQDALKVSSSMVDGINKLLESNTDAVKKKTEAEKGYQKSLKQLLDDTDDMASMQEKIARIEEEKNSIAKRYFGKNKEIGNVMVDSLSKEQERLAVMDLADTKAGKLADSLTSGLDGLHSQLGNIPVLGGLLQKITEGPLENMKSAIADSAKNFVVGFAKAAAGGKAGIMGFVKSSIAGFRAMGIAMLTGPQAVIFGLLAIVAAGIAAFAKMEAGAKSFRDETGLLNSQTKEMEGNIAAVYQSTVGLGASMEDVAKAAAEFTNEFGGIEQPSRQVMESMIVLNKNFGIATGDLAKINKLFTNLGGLSQDVAQSNIESLTALSQQAGVAPGKVMADIAEAAEDANGFFRGNIQALGASAINAAKMGSSLKEAVRVSKGLLDYQSSVSSEMEASAILQTNLNFSQSRYLAAIGKPAEAQAKMVEQLRKTVNLGQLNNYEAEALTKATGMSVLEMQNMARIQELGLSLDEDRAKLMAEASAAGLNISNMSEKEVRNQLDILKVQKERQGALEDMGNQMSAVGQELLMAFLPIGKVLVQALTDAMPAIKVISNALGSMVNGFIKVIGPIFKEIGDAFAPINDAFESIFGKSAKGEVSAMSKTFEIIGMVLSKAIAVPLKVVSFILRGIGNVMTGITEIMNGNIMEGLAGISVGILQMVKSAPMALIEVIGDIAYQIGKTIGGSVGQFVDEVKNYLKGSFIGQLFATPEELQGSFKEQSVEDAVISPSGNIISTSPEDFLIATKTPQSLGGGNISMDGVINELRELKAAFISNKDVYIDNEKITSRITRTQEKSNINQFGLLGA